MKKLEEAIRSSWSAETSFLPREWSEVNPARGQCAVTALILNDHLGGTIVKCDVKGETESHFYNKLKNGEIVDLTKEQFRSSVECSNDRQADREKILSYPGTQDRYKCLVTKVLLLV